MVYCGAVADDSLHPWRWTWLLAALLIVGFVVFIQQFSLDLRGVRMSRVPDEVTRSEEPIPPGVSDATVMSKLVVKARAAMREFEDDPLTDLEAEAYTRVERARMAIVAAELHGKDAGLQRLATLAAEPELGEEFRAELEWLRRVYEGGPDTIPLEAQQSLLDRHGWFGQLALSFGKPSTDRYRNATVGGFHRIEQARGLFGITLFACFLFGVLFLGVHLHGLWRAKYVPLIEVSLGNPWPRIEMLAVFLGGFLLVLLMQLFVFGIGAWGEPWANAASEVVLWLLVATLAWPLIRGEEWRTVRLDLGWYKGQGVRREVTAGITAFLASMPLVLIVSLVVSAVSAAMGEPESPQPGGYPVMPAPAGTTWGVVALQALTAVVWAPLVEETVMRGALYGLLRMRLGVAFSVAISAAVFGVIHPYTATGMIQVAVGGVVFALLREWRGSLIAPVVAHALHNAMVMSGTIILMAAVGD